MPPLTRTFLGFAVTAALVGAFMFWVIVAPTTESNGTKHRVSLSSLERRLATIDEQLLTLAKPSMRTGVGAVGYRSIARKESSHSEWIQITLAEETAINEIVLVPMIWRDTLDGFGADGFPLEFCIRIGVASDSVGTVVARYDANDLLLPRVAPLVVSFPKTNASWVRLEATKLSPRGWDGMYILQLAEILVFSGLDNVALRQPVKVSSSDQMNHGHPRHQDYLVDGFVPYLMDAHDGEQSLAFLSADCLGMTAVLSIDLGRLQSLSRIHLHTTELSDNVPQALADDFGIPRSLVVEGATKPDFSDKVRLCEYKMKSIYDVGPIIKRAFPETTCRYVRLTVHEPSTFLDGDTTRARVGFAEIELFSKGVNVALGAPVSVNLDPEHSSRSTSTLTDGNNLFGRILLIRDWLSELQLRHDLATERPRIVSQLNSRYQRQTTIVHRLSWLTGLLGLVAVCTVLVERSIRRRVVFQTRERIAADLHDELGANLHAIGLLGDLAIAASDSPSRLNPLLQRVRELTERSGAATRYCSNMLESETLFGDLLEDMKRTSGRLMADLDHEFSFEGERFIRELKPSIRIDVFLFYKECLTNILKHSHATRVTTCLCADRTKLVLVVSDNGCGLNERQVNRTPASLSRRARIAGAKGTAERLANGGTRITLEIRIKKLSVPWVTALRGKSTSELGQGTAGWEHNS